MFISGAGDLSGFTQTGSTHLDRQLNCPENGAVVVGFGAGRLQKAKGQDSGCGIYPRWKHKGPSCPGPTPAQTESQWPAEDACSALVTNRCDSWYRKVSRLLASLSYMSLMGS